MPPIRHDVTFTGQAETYAPIWRQNMLLLLLTAGFSLPWALSRSLRYFYRHTQVAGGHFDYHVNPLKMFAGNVVGTLVLNAIYYGISLTGPYKTVGVAAMQLLTAALLPLWMHGFLEFQLQHTSWNGHRMRLAATPADAFRAMWQPTLLYMVGGVLAVWAVVVGLDGARFQAYGLGAGAALTLAVALPWFYVQYKRYQHRYATLGPLQRADLPAAGDAAAPSYMTVRAAALALLALFVVVLPLVWGLSAWLGVDWALLARLKQPGHDAEAIRFALVLVPGFLLFFALMMALPYAYLSLHLQNRLLPLSGQPYLRVESTVPADELLKASARNWLRVVLTLGWHYPKVAIGEARWRLQSVSIWIDPEVLSALSAAPPSAEGRASSEGQQGTQLQARQVGVVMSGPTDPTPQR